MLVATKVTGSQVVEVTVMAYVLSTRSGIHKKLTSPLFKGNQLHDNNPSMVQFFFFSVEIDSGTVENSIFTF